MQPSDPSKSMRTWEWLELEQMCRARADSYREEPGSAYFNKLADKCRLRYEALTEGRVVP